MMHRLHILNVSAAMVLAVGAVACNNDKLTELNRNPNAPEDVPPVTLFTNAVQSAVSRWNGGGSSNLRGAEFIIQHMAEAQYPDEDRYTRLGAAQTQGLFTGPYAGELEDLKVVTRKGIAANDPGMWAPAEVLSVWSFANITNTFGDVPYSQALAADSAGGTTTPKYDMQKDIYTDLFRRLDAASKALSSASPSLGRADPMFGGDTKGWQRFANSLRARFAMLLVNVDKATADAQLRAALAAPSGIILSNAQNAKLTWPGDGVFDNPWASFFQGRDDNRMSQTLINILVANSDPRLPVYAQPTIDFQQGKAGAAQYAGMPNGLTASAAGGFATKASRPGAVFYPGATAYGFFGGGGKSWPAFLFTAAEGNLILAEAAERGIGGLTAAQAKSNYEAGVRASMDQWGVSASAASTYIASAAGAYKGGTAGLTQIAIEKWVALFSDGNTAWAEWRRTCQPATIKPGPAASISTIPRRFFYAPTEVSVNTASLNEAILRQGTDAFTTRMYWDAAPTAAPTFVNGCGQR
jgi:hypothetical protein